MAYYDAFIAAWNAANNNGAVPASVTGSAFAPADTTAQKLAKLNAWTEAGPITYSKVDGSAVQNCIALADWNAITDAQRSQVGTVTGVSGIGVDPTPGEFAANVLGSIFSGKTTTLNALVALQASAKNTPVIPWWQVAGYPRAFDLGDCSTAGVV